MNNYTSWKDLIDTIYCKTNIQYQVSSNPDHYGLSIDGKLPYSISEYEFNYIKDFIILNNLKNGYELATGIGISTIAIAQGLKVNNGKLITVDSYLEEKIQDQPISNINVGEDESLLRNIKMFKSLLLSDTVKAYKDFSPNCSSILDKEFNNDIDFVFFDCPKSADDFIRDATILKNKINKHKFAIFVHDTHCFPEDFLKLSNEIFGIEGKFITEFIDENNNSVIQKYPLAIISNIE